VGSLPPVLDLFPPVLFESEFSMRFSSREIERARVKIVVQMMMQKEFLTFFTADGRGLHTSEGVAQRGGILVHVRRKICHLRVMSRIKY
jgi:hypothetical protein